MDDGAPLTGRVVAVPESRHLDVLASLLEKRGASVLRCPLISIKDTPDEAAVAAWIERLIDSPPDLLVLYTGEGVERLVAFAERFGAKDRFVAALARTRTLTRGPKPKRALRALGQSPALEASEPTTAGIIATLAALDLDGRRVGIQIYGTEPNRDLLDYLSLRGAQSDCVAPYTYATAADDDAVADMILKMHRGEVDAIAFTSKAQVERLTKIAAERKLAAELASGLRRARVAAVGPVVAAELAAAGVRVDATPEESFHMKPLVNSLAELFASA